MPQCRSSMQPTRTRVGMPALLAAAVAAALLALAHCPGAAAHGFIAEPAARSYLRDWQNCPHCNNNGGPGAGSASGRLTWPQTTAPACGPPALAKAGRIVRNYSPGEVISIKIFITAQHGGRHVFRLCPSASATHACFKRNMLQRADGAGPYSWTPTTGGAAPGSKHSYSPMRLVNGASLPGESYTWSYRLPRGLKCKHCVLQWWWTTANSCKLPGAPSFVRKDTGMSACNTPGPYPEEFSGCADISIGYKPVSAPRPKTSPQGNKPAPQGSRPQGPAKVCTQATALAFCAKKSKKVDRAYANVAAGCACYFRCGPFGSGAASYTCPAGLRFSEALQNCDHAKNVPCGAARKKSGR